MRRASRFAALLLAAATGCAHLPGYDPGQEQTPPAATPAPAPAPTPEPSPPAPAATPPPASQAAPAAPSPGTSADAARAAAERLVAIRAGVDAFLRAQGQLLWNVWTRGAAPDLEPTLAPHRDLFTRDTVLFVRQARDAARGEDRRALSLLHAFLVGEFLGRATDGQAHVPGASVLWDGQPIATSRVPSLLAAEPSAPRRAQLQRAWAEAERGAAGNASARWAGIANAAQRLGYRSLVAAGADLRGEPVVAIAAFAEHVLASTDTLYRALMGALARAELNQGWADVRGRDLPRLLRSEDKRSLLPTSHAASSVRNTFAGMGMDLPSTRGLLLDDQERAGKDPRALTMPIEVPGDVRVSYVAADGASDVRGLLHELGAAVYYASIRVPEVEFRRLGTVTVTTWADLFGDLVGDPSWLADRAGREDEPVKALVRATAARRLHRARMLAAHLLDEIARERPAGRSGGASRKVLERALMRSVDDDELQVFVASRDPLLESADELRSMLLAADASAFLSRRAGAPWWRSKDSGAWLASSFAEGSRRSPVDLARSMGAEQIDTSALLGVTRARLENAGLKLP